MVHTMQHHERCRENRHGSLDLSSVRAVLGTLQPYFLFMFTQVLNILPSGSKQFSYIFTINPFLLLEVRDGNTRRFQS